jgi:hypothetical protein
MDGDQSYAPESKAMSGCKEGSLIGRKEFCFDMPPQRVAFDGSASPRSKHFVGRRRRIAVVENER